MVTPEQFQEGYINRIAAIIPATFMEQALRIRATRPTDSFVVFQKPQLTLTSIRPEDIAGLDIADVHQFIGAFQQELELPQHQQLKTLLASRIIEKARTNEGIIGGNPASS